MKANGAPEKIYLVIDPVWGSMSVNYNRNDTNNIEYFRADAFIEKAEKFIYSALNDGIMGTANIEDFMRILETIWKESSNMKEKIRQCFHLIQEIISEKPEEFNSMTVEEFSFYLLDEINKKD